MTDRGDDLPKDEYRSILAWELAGVAPIVLAGSALHFAFDWSSGWLPLALIAAVNKSVWERAPADL